MSPQYIVPLANLIAIILAGAALFLIPVGLLLWWGILALVRWKKERTLT